MNLEHQKELGTHAAIPPAQWELSALQNCHAVVYCVFDLTCWITSKEEEEEDVLSPPMGYYPTSALTRLPLVWLRCHHKEGAGTNFKAEKGGALEHSLLAWSVI